MKNSIIKFSSVFIGIIISVFSATSFADDINLDKSSKCADLICYQSLDNPDYYYYLPDQPRIAVKDGKPQFSFIKYSKTKEAEKAGTNSANGGGIVHFLVTYGVSDARKTAAQNSLREKNPNASLIGPIIYRKGSFALITSFTEDNAVTTKTVAVGKAPLMEGQKTAVSMALTKDGAELLWESFQSDTPDISLVFDMEFAGVREPYEATLEADWKRVASHKRFKAGGQYKWFGADIDIMFQELKQDGAIKITTKGENANMDKIIQSANAKLLQVMFEPGANDELNQMAADKSDYSSLDRAAKMLKDTAALRKANQSFNKTKNIDYSGKWYAKLLDLFVEESYAGDSNTKTDEEKLADARKIFEKAVKYYGANKYQKAIELADEANMVFTQIKKRPSIGCIWVKANSYYYLGKYNEAIKFYQETIDNVPFAEQASHKVKIAFGNLYIAMSLVEQKRFEEAQAYIDLSLTQNITGKEPEFYNDLGNSYRSMKKLPEAVAAYRKAMEYLSDASKNGSAVLRKLKEVYVEIYNNARKLDDNARSLNYKKESALIAYKAYKQYKEIVKPTNQKLKEVDSRLKYIKTKLEKAGVDPEKETAVSTASTTSGDSSSNTSTAASGSSSSTTAATPETKSATSSTATPSSSTTATSTAKSSATPSKASTVTSKKKATPQKSTPKKSTGTAKKATPRKSGFPGFSLVASYKMKKVKRSGKMVYKMNHFRNEMQAFAMAENIGSLFKKYGNDSSIFRAVNIDDPVFKQRDILVTLDGQDSATFGEHVNFVTVQMMKLHQNGDKTTDEVVITPELFNDKGNSFYMTYGWKGDSDREKWLNYKIKTTWSFHGGIQIESDWKTYDEAVVSLIPPHRYRTVSIEADSERLKEKKVRHVVVSLKSYINGKAVITQTTIRNRGLSPSSMVDIPESKSDMPTVIDMIWYLEGGKKIVGKPISIDGDILYWDEIPEDRS